MTINYILKYHQKKDDSKANLVDFDNTQEEIFNDLNQIKAEINEVKNMKKAECYEKC